MFRTLPFTLLALLLLVAAPHRTAGAQEARVDPPDVFIDCETRGCDFDFFRTEIPFVDYVRDREDADIHVLVTSESTGGGGRLYTFSFIGLRAFAGVDDELTYTSGATDSDDEVRRGLARAIGAGLVRYVARTPLLGRIGIAYTAPVAAENLAAETGAEEDPWNHWVFTTSVRGFANGESSYSYLNVFGSASANRTTEAWKTRLSLNASQNIQRFDLGDGEEVENIQENYGMSGLVVKSFGPHWSAGGRASASRNTRLNYDLTASLAPTIEYNVYPYSESTRKLLTFQYAVGPTFAAYTDTTLFDETSELLFDHSLSLNVRARQPWGSVGVSTSAQQYLHDLSKYNLDMGGNVEIRVFRGLSVEIGGNVEFVRAQLYLPKGDASDEDVLLRRRELATSWRYFANFGISYRFGSKFNNVVNPRFDSGGGGRMIFF